MPILENAQTNESSGEPNNPGAPGTLSYFKQGSARSTGVQMTTEGNLTMAGNLTVGGTITGPDVTPAWFNVKAYGASPSASAATNDAAIAAAIAAMPASGGTLYFPAGTYSISQAVSITTDAISIRGDGMNATQISQTSTTAHCISIIKAGPRFIHISDIMLDGPGSGTGQGIHIETTTATASASIDISRVFIQQFGGDGINSDTLITSVWQDVRVNSCGGYGFYLFSGTSMTLLSCYANSCTLGGYYFDSVTYSSAYNCAADSPGGYAYTVHLGGSVSFYSCGSEAGSSGGFMFESTVNCSTYSCRVSGNNAIAFWAKSSSTRIFFNNSKEINPGGSATSAVQVDSGCTAIIMILQATTANSLAANTTRQFTNTDIFQTNAGTVTVTADRDLTTSFASYILSRAGTSRWGFQSRNDSTDDMYIQNTGQGLTLIRGENRATQLNMSLLSATKDYQSGVGVIYVGDRTTAPTATPAAGALLYSDTQRLATFGPLAVMKDGAGLQVKEGANACMGTLTLNGATPVVVNTTAVTANSRIFLTTNAPGGVPAFYWVSARTAGTSFSVTGTAGDTSTVAWMIVEPA